MEAAANGVLERLHPVGGFPCFEPVEREDGEAYRVSPPITAGILVPALSRCARASEDARIRSAVRCLAMWLASEALEPGRPGIRGELLVDGADGSVIRRGRMRRGDWAILASRGFAAALEVHEDRGLRDAGRLLLSEAIRHLVENGLPMDGRGRSRALLGGADALGLLKP
jgi:hypothetical protein